MPERIPAPPKGKLIKGGSRFDRLFEQGRQVSQLTATSPLEVLRSPTGYHIRDTRLEEMWVEITFEPAIAAIHEYAYSAYRLRLDESTYEIVRDEEPFFHADTYPVIEMTENAELPEGAVFRVYPGIGGRYYTGVWAGAMANAAKQTQLCRVAGDSETVDGIDIYPALTQELNPNGGGANVLGWIDVEAVALAQRYNFPLTVGDGEGGPGLGGCYMAKRSKDTPLVMVFGAMYPLYITDAFPQMDENCVVKN